MVWQVCADVESATHRMSGLSKVSQECQYYLTLPSKEHVINDFSTKYSDGVIRVLDVKNMVVKEIPSATYFTIPGIFGKLMDKPGTVYETCGRVKITNYQRFRCPVESECKRVISEPEDTMCLNLLGQVSSEGAKAVFKRERVQYQDITLLGEVAIEPKVLGSKGFLRRAFRF